MIQAFLHSPGLSTLRRAVGLTFLAFLVTACGSYEGGEGSASSSSTTCAAPCADLLYISLGLPNPYKVPQGTTRIDVAGFCNPGDFSRHEIRWQMTEVANQAQTRSGTTLCEGGRYLAAAETPIGTSIGTSKRLRLKIVGFKTNVSGGITIEEPIENNFSGTVEIELQQK